MKKALCVVTILLVAGLANAELVPLQLVASEYVMPQTTQGDADVENTLGDVALLDSGMDPVVDTSLTGAVCMNYKIWAKVDEHNWKGLGFSVHATGDLTATVTMDVFADAWSVRGNNGKFLYGGTTFQRWNTGSDTTASAVGDNIVNMVAVQEPGLGGTGDIGVGATSVYGAGTPYGLGERGTWFQVGAIEVCGTNGGIFLDYRGTNFEGGLKGESIIYYGYAASGIVNLDENLGVIADAAFVTFVPEPASLILLALAGLAIRRR